MEIKHILVTNKKLHKLGGSETFTYSFIKELVSKGYQVEYFTFKKGIISKNIEKNLGVKFMSRKSYDVIFANHDKCVRHISSKGLTIQTCHGIFPKPEQPSVFADAYVAISQEVLNHIKSKGFSGKVILNGIDCDSYKSNTEIQKKLQNVLSLCQSEEANKVLNDACTQLDINFKYFNKNKNPIWDINKTINEHDLVVGIGRSAYEAMACGRPVLIYDNRSYTQSFADGYLTEDIIDRAIINNCSGRYFKKKFNANDIINDLKKYNSEDGKFLRNYVLKNLNIKNQVLSYLDYANNIQKKQNSFINFIKHLFSLKLKLTLLLTK